MLSKLAIEKIKDEYIPPLIKTWLRNSKLSDSNLNLRVDWFQGNDTIDKNIGNVYRGFHFNFDQFRGHLFDLFSNKSISLDSRRGYASWSSSPEVAQNFSRPDGIVISNSLSKNSNYIDLYASNNYLKSIGQDFGGTIIDNECEIITDELPCDNCKLKDIEFITCSLRVYHLFKKLMIKFEGYNIILKANEHKSLSFIMQVRGRDIIVTESGVGIPDLKLKPNIKCK